MSNTAKYVSHVQKFLREFDRHKATVYDGIGEVATKNIIAETPVDTGALKASNAYYVGENEVYVYNTESYAPFVEFGTYKMSPNPFMRRGINRSTTEIINVIVKVLKV